MKICAKCGHAKPTSEFGIHSRQKDGLQRNCKECQRKYFAEYRATKPDIVRRTAEKWAAANPGVTKQRSSDSRKADPERHREYSRTYRDRHPERRRATCANYRKNNEQRERIYRKIYASKNKDKLAAKSSMRRAVKLMATPRWANADVMLEIYAFAMRVSDDCKIAHHVDHIVPLISDLVCGLHCEANLRVITGSENQSKSNRYWPDMPT